MVSRLNNPIFICEVYTSSSDNSRQSFWRHLSQCLHFLLFGSNRMKWCYDSIRIKSVSHFGGGMQQEWHGLTGFVFCCIKSTFVCFDYGPMSSFRRTFLYLYLNSKGSQKTFSANTYSFLWKYHLMQTPFPWVIPNELSVSHNFSLFSRQKSVKRKASSLSCDYHI